MVDFSGLRSINFSSLVAIQQLGDVVNKLLPFWGQFENRSAAIEWVYLLANQVQARLAKPVKTREPVGVAAAAGGWEIKILLQGDFVTLIVGSHVQESGYHLSWHLSIKDTNSFDDLEQSLDLRIGELSSEWIHRIEDDSPILDATYPSGQGVQHDLATHPKRNPDQCPRTRGLNTQESCI